MQFFQYIKYFFYLASNWGLQTAFHIIPREISGEKKYGLHTTGADELESLRKKGIDTSHSTIYMPASYDLLETFFSETAPHGIKHLLDIGCGKGRAMCVAAHFNIPKVTGLELSAEFCIEARLNLEKTKHRFPSLQYEVINNDAFYFEIPSTVDCIFLFNPFDEMIMDAVLENIENSIDASPRKITVIYLNPLHQDLFKSYGYDEVFHHQKIKYLEGSVFMKK